MLIDSSSSPVFIVTPVMGLQALQGGSPTVPEHDNSSLGMKNTPLDHLHGRWDVWDVHGM